MADDYQMPKGELMRGKRGIVTGVANHQSHRLGHCQPARRPGRRDGLPAPARHGAPRAAAGREPRGQGAGAGGRHRRRLDDAGFAAVEKAFGTIDFFVHAIAFAPKDQISGSFVENASRAGFLQAMEISVYSFADCARRAAAMMPNGGSIITLTYMGSERAIPNYNTMGVAKAGLEAAARYAARDLGPKGIRVNALSPGAMRTLSLAGIQGGPRHGWPRAAGSRP